MNSILYNHLSKQTQLLQKDITTFEKNPKSAPLSLLGSITTTLNGLNKTVEEYDQLSKQEIDEEKKLKAITRVLKFKEEIGEAKTTFIALKREREEAMHEANRTELLGRRAHNTGTPDNPYSQFAGVSGSSQQLQSQQPSSGLSYQEGLYKEKNILGRGSQQLDEILEMGRLAFDDIVEQNELLRRAQTKMVETLNTLGVSNETIRTIERRARQDKWLFWGGVIFTFICFYYIFKWFR